MGPPFDRERPLVVGLFGAISSVRAHLHAPPLSSHFRASRLSVTNDSPISPADPASEHGELTCPPLRIHQPRRALPTDVVRPTRAEVHLDALRWNLAQLRKVTREVPIWGVLKADAYGHGSKAAARTLERAGIDGLCVALVEEGIELREAGIELPILVMGGYYRDAHRELQAHRLIPVLSDAAQAESLGRAARAAGGPPTLCHVKVDTGMSRLGVRSERWDDLLRTLRSEGQLEVDGLMSHLANADVDVDDAFEAPLRLFRQAREHFLQAGFRPARLHLANSAAVLREPRTHFDLVRPGLALYGVDPGPASRADPVPIRLRAALSISTRVVSLRDIRAGDTVGYGGTFRAREARRIATIPMGYADGLSRALSNRGHALMRGKRVPIVGNVSMDMTTLDVTELPGAAIMDEVVLLGRQKGELGSDEITATEIAEHTGTIPWEVLTNISRRVPRFYREA